MTAAAQPISQQDGETAAHETARGAYGWFATVDHKRIGILYLLTALFYFGVGGIEALLIRLQLAHPEARLLSPDTYNQIFTMHGTTMIFLVVMPTLVGFANYFVPLMIGARDMAFPRLNAMSYWLFPFGGALLHFSFFAGGGPSAGWFSYAPLSETPFSSSPGTDYWALALLVLGVGSVAGGINVIATVLTLRAPGMTIRRLPLFVWMTFITAILIILALPVLNAALVMLLIDRQLDVHFFQTGGSAILWQHFFWTFGHPEVYIMALPAFGMISEIIPVFSRKPIFGYDFVAASTLAIAVLSFGVWAHHMFAAGLGHRADLAFAAASMLIAIPTGVKIFNWIATMWGGSIRFTVAMYFAVAFLLEFVVGGLSGITFAAAPISWQMTDTYYVVAHFHYVLFGGTALAVFGAVYYWFPKMTGKMLSERIGLWHFWLTIIGFNLTFFVQHILGMLGMPRRVYTYPDLPHWGTLNMTSTLGSLLMAVSVLVFFGNILWSLKRGEPAGENPWEGWSLEWATSSPPPHDNFDKVPPVRGRRPLWEMVHEKKRTKVVKLRRYDKGVVAMWAFIASEAGFFLILIITYLLFNQSVAEAAAHLELKTTLVFSVCLFSSSFTMHMSERAHSRDEHAAFRAWLGATLLLGGIFIVGQAREYHKLLTSGLGVSSSLFASTFFTLTGFHGLHVTIGLIALAVLFRLALSRGFEGRGKSALKAVGLYWHFVDVVWVAVFSVVYLRSLA